MRQRVCTIIASLFFSSIFYAQVRVVKPLVNRPKETNLALGVGVSRSTLYLQRNVKTDNDAKGLAVNLVYGGENVYRTSLEYIYYFPIDIGPTWYNVKAHSIEANVNAVARFEKTKSYFYPLLGLSYNMFSGFFTGINDYLNLASLYPVYSNVSTSWLGLNIGTGYELFFMRGSFYVDYRMKIGRTEGLNQLNIMDVCFGAGLRYNLKVPTLHHLFKGTRSRYSLKSKKSH